VGDARVWHEGERSTLRVGDDYRVEFRIDQIADESRVIRFKPVRAWPPRPAVEGNERYAPVLDTVLTCAFAAVSSSAPPRWSAATAALFMTNHGSLPRP